MAITTVRDRGGCDGNNATLNLNKMISADNKFTLLDALQNAFPLKTVKGNSNDDGTVNLLLINVPEINADQLSIIAGAVKTTGCDFSLKRSGTGITASFQ